MCAVWLAVLLGAPDEEAVRLLKTAWASQYEWKEDGVANATLPFRYEIRESGDGDRSARYEGEGELVLVGGEVVRRHYRATAESRQKELDGRLDWVVARFVRRPFDEVFKEANLAPPEACGDGSKRIAAGRTDYYVKEDRIVAIAVPARGSAGGRDRVDYMTGKMRDGYGILGERYATGEGKDRFSTAARLELRADSDIPAPERAEWTLEYAGGKTVTQIRFGPCRFNLDEPVLLDPGARDVLKAAWEHRYVLPAAIRLEGEFVRKADPVLGRFGMERVSGLFQVRGLDRIDVMLDDKLFRDPSRGWVQEIQKAVQQDFQWVFRWLDPRPFDEEFKGCGFRKGDNGIVHVLGYPRALAFRVENESIAAHLENAPTDDAWWEHKGRPGKDGFLLERLTRKVEGKLYEQRIRYQKSKGLNVPSGFDLFLARTDQPVPAFGLNEYELKKLRVEIPK